MSGYSNSSNCIIKISGGGPVRTVLMMIVTPVLLDERLRIRYYQINTLHQQQKKIVFYYTVLTRAVSVAGVKYARHTRKQEIKEE